MARAKQFDEADAVLASALARSPENKNLLIHHALSAHNSGRYAEAVTRWQRVRDRAPKIEMGHAGLAANLRELGRLDEAADVIAAARLDFGETTTVLTEAARIAFAQGRFADARDFWGRAIACRRPHPDWLQGHAQALVRLGAFADAETALRAARQKHPGHAGLLGVEGALHAAREDWPRAEAHWRAYRRLHPDDPTGWEQLGIAVEANAHAALGNADRKLPLPLAGRGQGWGSGRASLSPSLDSAKHTSTPTPNPSPQGGGESRGIVAPLLPAHIDIVEDETIRALLLHFESIGEDCEFGLVQRRYGAEPLGLLRWNTVPIDALLAALDARFDGMGEPANTRLVTAPSGEFYVEDTRWSLGMHTFLHAGGTDADTLLPRMCQRIAYLRDKLVADLTVADKTFVYRLADLDETRLEALHRALAAFGPVRLLAVQPDAAQAGELERVDTRRFTGFLRRPGVDASGRWNIAYEGLGADLPAGGGGMTEADIFAALAPIFAGIFGRTIALSPGLAAKDVSGWDSFRQVEILIAAEARFGLKFSSAEIDHMRCLGDLVAIVMARGQV